MVSAKFHLLGEAGEWFRIRVQEEVYAHGLEGSVLLAAENTLAVIVEGDKSKIKRLHTDMGEVCPENVVCTDLIFSIHRPAGGSGLMALGTIPEDKTVDYIFQLLKELDKRTARIEQKLNRLTAQIEGGAAVTPPTTTTDAASQETATTGFAAMFGNE